MNNRLMNYVWREVPDFPDYEVTSLGYIRKTKSKVLHSTHYTKDLETVLLTKDGKRYHRTVKSVVKSAFPDVLYP